MACGNLTSGIHWGHISTNIQYFSLIWEAQTDNVIVGRPIPEAPCYFSPATTKILKRYTGRGLCTFLANMVVGIWYTVFKAKISLATTKLCHLGEVRRDEDKEDVVEEQQDQ